MTRHLNKHTPKNGDLRDELKRKGWTISGAARECGCTFRHLFYVIKGERHSRRLVSRIQSLPDLSERRAS